MRAGRTRGYIRVFFFPLSLSLHFLVWDCGGGVDWCLLFGGFRKVQARSSWFGYKTDIYRFYLLFFSHLVWFSLFSTRSLSGDVYCGVEAGLLQGYNVVCCCWGISFCCCWVSKSVSVVCFLVLYVVSGVISCVARIRIHRVSGRQGGQIGLACYRCCGLSSLLLLLSSLLLSFG